MLGQGEWLIGFFYSEKIPGLGAMIEKLTDSISVFVYTTLEVSFNDGYVRSLAELLTAVFETIASNCQ